jgi:phage-related protein (TIGR01555 family)
MRNLVKKNNLHMLKRKRTPNSRELTNTLTTLFSQLGPFNTAQLSQTDTQFLNLRYYLITNDRNLLTFMYTEHGIVQTLIDQPVDDAFRNGYDIKTSQLDEDEINELEVYIERERINHTIGMAMKWTRLYGGGGIMVMTDQKPDEPLRIEDIKKDTPLEFKSADLWELFNYSQNLFPFTKADYLYNYYGYRVHESRVYELRGKEAPSWLRQRLRGWGLSELEKVVRALNQFMKHQNVVFELLDEAKVDVYKMDGYNSSLITDEGTNLVAKRVQLANQMKNFQNALTLDKDDDYEQKQYSFSGLPEILKQIRESLASDLKMPVTKLFGISSAGFNSGEDDIENYNGMVESEVRAKVKFVIVDILSLCCQRLFGMMPDDLQIEFKPLRMLSSEQEQAAKNSKFNRVMATYTSGLADPSDAKEAINRESLLPVDLDTKSEPNDPIEPIDKDYSVTDRGSMKK